MPPHEARVATGNRILDALPPDEFSRLRQRLEPVPLSRSKTLQPSGEEESFVYFPASGMISVVSTLADGSAVEVGTIGSEGLAGLSVLFGAARSPHMMIVQGAGTAFRASATALREELKRSVAFRDVVHKFAALFLAQISQTAACNGRHRLEERCARWLLMMADRLQSDQFPLTQEFLAMLLGVRRQGVTTAALGLQRSGLIRYSHGQLDILDREGLEAASCECYGVIKDQLDRFLRD